jgi:dipeptidyl aminopeptidase/acylaminoacyl peptidase
MTDNKGKKLYLQGEGYSPMGNRPFIDEYDLASGNTKRLYQASGEETYERIRDIRNISKGELITTIESPGENPNYYLRNIYKRIAPMKLTNFENPYASIKGVSKQMISYKRDDGVDLNAVLYLPEGYDKEKDGPLPMLMWAYPREYKDLKAAGMVKDSPHRFTYVSYGSPIF